VRYQLTLSRIVVLPLLADFVAKVGFEVVLTASADF
jgi:hypothetical protein